MDKIQRLINWSVSDNIAADLKKELLGTIGQRVVDEYKIDKNSRHDWEVANEEAMKLARQVRENVSEPWENAANVKYPLITVAVIQFASRVYPEIIRGNEVVKTKVIGADPDGSKKTRGERVGRHMSWQLTEQMEDWESDTDKLLHILPIMGCAFRKTYRNVAKGKNISELCLPEDVVVNNRTKQFDAARRVTHRFWLHQNDIYENIKQGIWLEEEFGKAQDPDNPHDEDALHEFLEQHRYWDLDEDGYQEPYIVTIHKETAKVVRIVARFEPDGIILKNKNGKNVLVRIEPEQYFTLYPFIPEMDGSFYPLGFGKLMGPLNESINTIINQLLDSGTLANLGGGFLGRGLRLPGGKYKFKPGEWKPVDATGQSLRENIFPLPTAQPSPTLFQLLGLLIEASRDVSSIKDVLTGDAAAIGPNTPVHTVMAMVEQGLKVFGAITKRLYKALKSEYRKLYRLNQKHLEEEEYFTVLDEPEAVGPQDYNTEDFNIIPVADPTMASDMQRMMKMRALLEMTGRPGMNEVELTRMAVTAIDNELAKTLLLPDDQIPKPPPDPRLIEVQGRIAAEQLRLGLETNLHGLEMEKLLAEIEKIRADAIAAIAKAEAEEAGTQIDQYRESLKFLQAEIKSRADMAKEMVKLAGSQSQSTGTSGMAQ